VRNPLDRLTSRVPEPWRSILDWTFSIVVAVVVVLAVKVEVANPYRVPSASMEPTLHCARPADGCLAAHSDRVVANRFIYRFRDPKRGEIVVFDAPAKTIQACAEGGTFVKRIVGLPGEVVSGETRRLHRWAAAGGLRPTRVTTGRSSGLNPQAITMMATTAASLRLAMGTVPRENPSARCLTTGRSAGSATCSA
jgi:hypothetical protein